MPAPSRRSKALLRAAFVPLTLAILGAPLALGGAPPWVVLPLLVAAALAAWLALFAAQRAGQNPRLPEAAWLFVAAIVLVLLQLVPLPGFALGLLSPSAEEVRAFVLEPLGIGGMRPVSQDPPGTWREVAKHIAYALIFVAACELARSRRFRRWLVASVALAGLVIAAIGVGHLLAFEPQQNLFGHRVFQWANSPLPSPIGNPNHLASFLALAATCALGLLLDRDRASGAERSLSRRWVWAPVYLLTSASVFLTLSRGGVAAFIVSQAVLVALLAGRVPEDAYGRSGREPLRLGRLRVSVAAVAAVAFVVSVAVYAGHERLVAELRTVDSPQEIEQSKIALWPMMAKAAAQFPLGGMGRGAFEAAFTRYQTDRGEVVFTHAENWPLHLAAEFGLVPAVILLALVAWLLARRVRQGSFDALALTAAAALAGVLLHDLLDFSLELPATAVSSCVLFAVFAARKGEAPQKLRLSPFFAAPRKTRLSPFFVAVPAATVVALLAVAFSWGQSPREVDRRLAAAIEDARSTDELLALAREHVSKRPADFYVHSRLAAAFSVPPHADPAIALAFANRALFLRPIDSGAHVSAARALLALGRRTQAMLELRLAYRASGDTAPLIEGVQAARTAVDIDALGGDDARCVHDVAHFLRRAGRRAEAEAYLAERRILLSGGPSADVARLFSLSAQLAEDRGDHDAALALAERAAEIDPESRAIPLVRAGVLVAAGRVPQAVDVLEHALSKHPGDFEISIELAHALTRLGDRHGARQVIARVSPLLDGTAERMRAAMLEARLFREDGRFTHALDRYRLAAQIDPGSPWPRYSAAEVLERLGRHADAVREIEAGMRLEGTESAERRAWVERLEARRREIERGAETASPDPAAFGERGL